jgi:hypothetical protein
MSNGRNGGIKKIGREIGQAASRQLTGGRPR